MTARGPVFVTPHAVARFRERVPWAGRLSSEQALAELTRQLAAATRVSGRGGTRTYQCRGFRVLVDLEAAAKGPLPVARTVLV